MQKPSFEVAPDTRKLIEFLHDREQATYSEMNKAINRVVNGRDRYVLQSALRQLQRDHDLVFVIERNVGIKRATNGQKAALGTDHVITRVHRSVRRGQKIQRLVNTQGLTPEERAAFWIGSAMTQAALLSVSKKMKSKIEEELKDRDGEAIDVKELIALFAKRAH